MSDLFRPRRRPLLRAAIGVCAGLLLAAAAVSVVWLRTSVVPPGCEDPATLALVRRSLTDRFGLPSSVIVRDIRTLSGGYLAFRIRCEADLAGIDPHDLPPGTALPNWVHYVSRMTDGGLRHEVTVSIQPVLKYERVQ